MRLNRIEWLNNCNFHDIKCDVFNHYKQAKRDFRDAQRSAIDEYESFIAHKIENDIDVDQKSVWIILNKRKHKPHTCTALKKDGTLFTDSNDLMSIWQGSILSAKLYLIFINDLIEILESCQQGAFIHDLNASLPVQADDISIIATDRQSSQVMFNICEEYSIRWSFAFSAGKIQLLHFGKRTTGTDVLLNNEPISTVKTATHCGIKLYTCLKSMDRTIDVCRTLCATVISLIRLGVHPAILNPIVCSKFVKEVCYPKALYGCKLWDKLTSTEWLMLERTQHYICKNI
ncbi:unnamed protein product [Mytilus coruscus]|uniref:Reverse transcriptase domain-containing protein n=1 Tax=Mytilus coruscus TaxID=42192 RepID=A0A6J8C7R0_MYTCO|nr:unnamed protein product [Mytilus coruscus]